MTNGQMVKIYFLIFLRKRVKEHFCSKMLETELNESVFLLISEPDEDKDQSQSQRM